MSRPSAALSRLRRMLNSAHDAVPPRTSVPLPVDDGEALLGWVREVEDAEAVAAEERHVRLVRDARRGRG